MLWESLRRIVLPSAWPGRTACRNCRRRWLTAREPPGSPESVTDTRAVLTPSAPRIEATQYAIEVAGATFILMESAPLDPAGSAAALEFFDWDYKRGSNLATDLGYVPMPGNVVALIERFWAEKIKTAGGASVFRR